MPMKQTDQWLQEHREELIASLQTLVRFPSTKGEPAPGAPFGPAIKDCLTAATPVHSWEARERIRAANRAVNCLLQEI